MNDAPVFILAGSNIFPLSTHACQNPFIPSNANVACWIAVVDGGVRSLSRGTCLVRNKNASVNRSNSASILVLQ